MNSEEKKLLLRVTVLEKKLEAVIKAIHLMNVSVAPTSEWLDTTLSKIDSITDEIVEGL